MDNIEVYMVDKEYYSDNMDWTGLKRLCATSGRSERDICNEAEVSPGYIAQVTEGKYLPDMDSLLRVCCILGGTIGSAVSFNGYEIKDRYAENKAGTEGDKVSFEPLRSLFFDAYGDKWKEMMNRFFDKVCNTNGVPGLNSTMRSKIRNDQSVNIRIVYNMCKVLGCTPDYVIGSKE